MEACPSFRNARFDQLVLEILGSVKEIDKSSVTKFRRDIVSTFNCSCQ